VELPGIQMPAQPGRQAIPDGRPMLAQAGPLARPPGPNGRQAGAGGQAVRAGGADSGRRREGAGQALSSKLIAWFVGSYSLVASSPPRGRYARRMVACTKYGLIYCACSILPPSCEPSAAGRDLT